MFNEGALLGTKKKKNNSDFYLATLTIFTEVSLYPMEAHFRNWKKKI